MAPDRLRAAAAAAKGGVAAVVKKRASVLEIRKRPARSDASGVGVGGAREARGWPGGVQDRGGTGCGCGGAGGGGHAATVGGAGRFGSEAFDEREEEEEVGAGPTVVETTFVAPAGQSGDGRTSLNDKLGY